MLLMRVAWEHQSLTRGLNNSNLAVKKEFDSVCTSGCLREVLFIRVGRKELGLLISLNFMYCYS